MVDIEEKLKQLMAVMKKGGIKRLYLKEGKDFEIELERAIETYQKEPPSFVRENIPAKTEEKPIEPKVESPKEEGKGTFINSPMVGTFYVSSSPDEAPYVKVGDRVKEDTVVCIIEAMKVMNEVKAGVGGTIKEILLENGHPVEYGTKLFRIE